MKITNSITVFSASLLLLLSGCGSDSTPKKLTPIEGLKLIISEVLADNNSTNTDPDLNLFSDWIEIQNASTKELDISGYGLSDTSKEIKWSFPNGTKIAADAYLLIWADDFNATLNPNPTALHTNFKIKSNDESVALFDSSGALIDQVKLKNYKTTKSDISVARGADGTFALATTPTPGTINNSASVAISKKPDFSVSEGVYASSFDVTITARNGADIYYTLDGSDATEDSMKYTNPISISENKTTLKAIAKEQGSDKLISSEKSVTYVVAPAHSVVINELFADNNKSNVNQYIKNDWIELYNNTATSVVLDGYKLSDSKKLENSNWTFPTGTTIDANGYLMVFADDNNSTTELRTDFKLSNNGDSVVLYNGNDLIIDFIDYGSLKDEQSLSRQGDNNFTKVTPTPNAVNSQ